MTGGRASTAALAAVLATWACSRRAPIASCDDDLGGVYTADPERTQRSDRWMVLDRGSKLEAYPLFPDADGPADLVVAPRVIDLARGPGSTPGAGAAALGGTLRRRYMRRAARCDAHVPVHVTRCGGDTLELVLADPAPPLAFAPCAWPAPSPSRLVRWHRE